MKKMIEYKIDDKFSSTYFFTQTNLLLQINYADSLRIFFKINRILLTE